MEPPAWRYAVASLYAVLRSRWSMLVALILVGAAFFYSFYPMVLSHRPPETKRVELGDWPSASNLVAQAPTSGGAAPAPAPPSRGAPGPAPTLPQIAAPPGAPDGPLALAG